MTSAQSSNTVHLRVGGMSCGGCVASVTRVLKALPGVAAVDVSLAQGVASVQFDPVQVGFPQFQSAVEGAGFDPDAS